MRIGVLVENLKVGGVEKVALRQVEGLRDLGFDAYLLVLRGSQISKEGVFELDEKKTPVIALDDRLPQILKLSFKFPIFAFFSLYHLTYALFLPFFVRKGEYDYIVSHGSYTSFSAATISLIKGIPFSIFFWDPISYILNRVYKDKIFDPLLRLFSVTGKFIDYLLLRVSGPVLVGSDEHTNYFKGLYSDTVVKRILPGTVLGKPTENKEKYVFALTAWKEGKHPEYMIELAKKLPGVKFKIGGKWLDDGLLKEFKEELKKNKMENQFEILGYIPEKELWKIYSEATVLLTTNLEKGFGVPVLEASSCGTTFIVPEGSGVCKVFKNGIDGFFLKERDTRGIVEKIKLLSEDSDLAVEMGRNAYNKIKKDFTWKEHAKNLVDALGIS